MDIRRVIVPCLLSPDERARNEQRHARIKRAEELASRAWTRAREFKGKQPKHKLHELSRPRARDVA